MARLTRDLVAIARYKREKWAGGCEVCGWKPPTKRALAVHHVIPVACGGTDKSENLILLCPNHHALAHVVGRRLKKAYVGPQDKPSLALALGEAYEQEVPESFQKAVAARMRTLINNVKNGEPTRSLTTLFSGAQKTRAQRVVKNLLAQRDEGCTAKQIHAATGIDLISTMGTLDKLYLEGTAAYVIVPDSLEQVWFDIATILARARAQ